MHASITPEETVMLYQLGCDVMQGKNSSSYESYTDQLIMTNKLCYIERKEYFGELPELCNLKQEALRELSSEALIGGIIFSVPVESWDNLSQRETDYLNYELPHYQYLNHHLKPYKTRLVTVAFGNEHDFVIAVPLEDDPQWAEWQALIQSEALKLVFYPPMDESGIRELLRSNLPTIYT